MKKIIRLKYILFSFILSLFSCNEHKFSESDFIGTWKSSDGAEITINKEGTCILDRMDAFIVNAAAYPNKSKKLNANGTWKIVNGVDNGMTGSISTGIRISYNLMDRIGTGSRDFYIGGQGFFGNKPPWYLFIWKGDPDDMIEYKFIKQ